MLETKYSKFLTILLVIIIIAVIGLVGYLGFNYFRNYSINKDSSDYVSTFAEEVTDSAKQTGDASEDSGESLSQNINAAEANSNSGVKTYKGFPVVGTIEIPTTGIEYPILQDPPTVQKLDTAVVALYPQNAVVNTEGNVVIVGHNYRNGMFFSDNKKLSAGDKVYITGLDGQRVTYEIYDKFQAKENDTSFYNRDTEGKREVTLSSCTDASDDNRIIVLAREVEE